MSDEDQPTTEQDAWVKLARHVREQLAAAVGTIPTMKPEDVKTFVEACRTALWLEQNAAGYDKEVELDLGRTLYSN